MPLFDRAHLSSAVHGCCRLAPALARSLAGAMTTWAPAVARLRAQGRAPSHRREARARIGARNATHAEALSAWYEANGSQDSQVFLSEVLPLIRAIPLRRLAEATGLSVPYCGEIRGEASRTPDTGRRSVGSE